MQEMYLEEMFFYFCPKCAETHKMIYQGIPKQNQNQVNYFVYEDICIRTSHLRYVLFDDYSSLVFTAHFSHSQKTLPL